MQSSRGVAVLFNGCCRIKDNAALAAAAASGRVLPVVVRLSSRSVSPLGGEALALPMGSPWADACVDALAEALATAGLRLVILMVDHCDAVPDAVVAAARATGATALMMQASPSDACAPWEAPLLAAAAAADIEVRCFAGSLLADLVVSADSAGAASAAPLAVDRWRAAAPPSFSEFARSTEVPTTPPLPAPPALHALLAEADPEPLTGWSSSTWSDLGSVAAARVALAPAETSTTVPDEAAVAASHTGPQRLSREAASNLVYNRARALAQGAWKLALLTPRARIDALTSASGSDMEAFDAHGDRGLIARSTGACPESDGFDAAATGVAPLVAIGVVSPRQAWSLARKLARQSRGVAAPVGGVEAGVAPTPIRSPSQDASASSLSSPAAALPAGGAVGVVHDLSSPVATPGSAATSAHPARSLGSAPAWRSLSSIEAAAATPGSGVRLRPSASDEGTAVTHAGRGEDGDGSEVASAQESWSREVLRWLLWRDYAYHRAAHRPWECAVLGRRDLWSLPWSGAMPCTPSRVEVTSDGSSSTTTSAHDRHHHHHHPHHHHHHRGGHRSSRRRHSRHAASHPSRPGAAATPHPRPSRPRAGAHVSVPAWLAAVGGTSRASSDADASWALLNARGSSSMTWMQAAFLPQFGSLVAAMSSQSLQGADEASAEAAIPASLSNSVPTRALWLAAGQTGYPLIDAAVQALTVTGELCTRLKRLLVVHAAQYLHLPWPVAALWVADLLDCSEPFVELAATQHALGGWLDYEEPTPHPHTMADPCARLYAFGRDPQARFVRAWIPNCTSPRDPRPRPYRPWERREAATMTLITSGAPAPGEGGGVTADIVAEMAIPRAHPASWTPSKVPAPGARTSSSTGSSADVTPSPKDAGEGTVWMPMVRREAARASVLSWVIDAWQHASARLKALSDAAEAASSASSSTSSSGGGWWGAATRAISSTTSSSSSSAASTSTVSATVAGALAGVPLPRSLRTLAWEGPQAQRTERLAASGGSLEVAARTGAAAAAASAAATASAAIRSQSAATAAASSSAILVTSVPSASEGAPVPSYSDLEQPAEVHGSGWRMTEAAEGGPLVAWGLTVDHEGAILPLIVEEDASSLVALSALGRAAPTNTFAVALPASSSSSSLGRVASSSTTAAVGTGAGATLAVDEGDEGEGGSSGDDSRSGTGGGPPWDEVLRDPSRELAAWMRPADEKPSIRKGAASFVVRGWCARDVADTVCDLWLYTLWDLTWACVFPVRRLDATNEVIYFATDPPPAPINRFVSPRDFPMLRYLLRDEQSGEHVVVFRATTHRLCPQRKGFTRGITLGVIGFVIQEVGPLAARVTFFTATDARGTLPIFLINWIAQGVPPRWCDRCKEALRQRFGPARVEGTAMMMMTTTTTTPTTGPLSADSLAPLPAPPVTPDDADEHAR